MLMTCLVPNQHNRGYVKNNVSRFLVIHNFHTFTFHCKGWLDPEGYLTLTGRIKELINRGGEKISPLEVR
jgi:non-ribosomal peptide synthetase component E (peptide arylation enzyme)